MTEGNFHLVWCPEGGDARDGLERWLGFEQVMRDCVYEMTDGSSTMTTSSANVNAFIYILFSLVELAHGRVESCYDTRRLESILPVLVLSYHDQSMTIVEITPHSPYTLAGYT